mgnify:CR=1 FL=1
MTSEATPLRLEAAEPDADGAGSVPRHRLGRLLYGSFLYRLTLMGRAPDALAVTPVPVRLGDAGRGNAILRGTFPMPGNALPARAEGWFPEDADTATLAVLHGFAWLGDLRAAGGEAAVHRGRDLLRDWLDAADRWHPVAWRADVLGLRLAAWLTHFDFFLSSADRDLHAAVLASLARQARHLGRVAGRTWTVRGHAGPIPRLLVAKGLLFAGVCLPGEERLEAQGERLLESALAEQLLPDGGHVQRDPARHAEVLGHLVDLRAMLAAAHRESAGRVQQAVDSMAPILRLLRHGDSGLALFNGADEGDTAATDALLGQCGTAGTTPLQAPQSGFQRLGARKTTVLLDAGPPPPPGADTHAHAGPLAFEMSVGPYRLVVNCGARPGAEAAWRDLMRGTAAHSTVTVADTNAAEVLPGGGLGRRPKEVPCERNEEDGNTWLEASHDGYRDNLGIVHQRRLYLAADGSDLRGEDTLFGPAGHPFSVRFHLHPSVQASMVQSGGAVLLRLPNGQGWRLHGAGGKLSLEESIYLGRPGTVRHTLQVVLAGTTRADETVVKWRIGRVGRR